MSLPGTYQFILPMLAVGALALAGLPACDYVQGECASYTVLDALCGDDDDSAVDDSQPSGDDDDCASGDDGFAGDDDSALAVFPQVTAVTFAASLEGVSDEKSEQGAEVTALSGSFQFLYWTRLEDQILACRQRFRIDALGLFGSAMKDACEGCGGEITVMSASPENPETYDKACGQLAPETDLSFLLIQEDIAIPSDFRRLTLVSTDQLVEQDWQISPEGLAVSELVSTYENASLRPYWVAFVPSSGWLGQDARLEMIATSWPSETSLLPMFMVYRDDTSEDLGWDMVGSCFLSTLWTVRVGLGIETEGLP